MSTKQEVETIKEVMNSNDEEAQKNIEKFNQHNVFSMDFLGAVGSGKTLLIEELIKRTNKKIGVFAGDQDSAFDAGRFDDYDVPVIGLSTGMSCHLDSYLVEDALDDMPLDDLDWVIIENVGNIVCPTGFKLGTHARVVIVSVTEGDDIVEKHPPTIEAGDVIIINKIDVADAVEVDVNKMVEDAQKINPDAIVIPTSLKTGENIDKVIEALENLSKQ